MNILLLSTGYPTSYQPLNGIFYYDQLLALAKAGNNVAFLAIVPTSLKDFISKGWKNHGKFYKNENGVQSFGEIYVAIPKWFSQRYRRTLQSGKKYFLEYLKNNSRPDIVHLHGFEGGKMAQWIKNEFGIPYVVTEHSSRFLDGSITAAQLAFAKNIFSDACYRIAVSRSFSEKLKSLTDIQFEIIPNIVDTGFFSPGINNKKFIFLSAGTLNENKNQSLQIDAFSNLVMNFPDSELWIAGDGLMNEKLKQKIGNTKNIKLLGWLSRDQLRDRMQEASCFLITSKYESFGVVAIEAMSCGLPVISTPCGGPESIILQGENGWICENSIEGLSSKMREVLTHRDFFHSENIRRYAVNNFSNEAIAQRLCNVYSQYI